MLVPGPDQIRFAKGAAERMAVYGHASNVALMGGPGTVTATLVPDCVSTTVAASAPPLTATTTISSQAYLLPI